MSLDTARTRELFLRCMSAIFLMAFLSLYLQIRGLYGSRGVMPAFQLIREHATVAQCVKERLSIVCLAPHFNLSTEHTMELLALLGTLLAAGGVLFSSVCKAALFVLLCCFYASLLSFGQTFLHFQWDSLLLEAGWLCVVAAPITRSGPSPHAPLRFWLVRWLLFRLMFASGLVKLQSFCPTWWRLTALTVHYESQCIPTPAAWFAHQFPVWFHKLCVVATYFIEIALPLLFFSPLRSHRLLAFYGQVLLQVNIIMTGNYNFFNLLTLTLCLSLLDDKHLGYTRVRDLSLGFLSFLKSLLSRLGYWLVLGVFGYYTVQYFALTINKDMWILESKTAFTKADLASWVESAVPASIALAGFSLAIASAEAMSVALFEPRGFFGKFQALATTLCYGVVVVGFFALSLVPYSTLDARTYARLAPPLVRAHNNLEPYHLTSSYGLFRRMTGVDGRPEVVLEGANAVSGPWLEYEFSYKPGNVARPPPIVAPHQPRLDWQLWFAALGTYNHNPWLLSLAYRLLQGTPEVTRMLDAESPWRNTAPKYIRATKYIYSYTKMDETSPNWWSRQEEGEYFPVFSADHPPFVQYLTKVKLLGGADPYTCTNPWLCKTLDYLYLLHCDTDSATLVWGVLLALLAIMWTRSKIREF